MNTIKITKIDNIATEQHDPSIIDSHTVNIFGKDIEILKPCNLNIFITNRCHNSCYFCINKESNKIDELSDIEFGETLEILLKEISGKGFEITLTGGEPTLLPKRFCIAMELCHKYNLPCRTISTTGIGVFSKVRGIPIYQHMIENEFTHNISISRMHYLNDINDKILGAKNIKNSKIFYLSEFFKMHGAELRISCNLIPGYIDNFEEFTNFSKFYMESGVDSVLFRQLILPSPLFSISEAMIFYNIAEAIKTNTQYKLVEKIDNSIYYIHIFIKDDYLVKIYVNKFKSPIIGSFAFKDGIFADNFSGENIKIDLRRYVYDKNRH